MAAMLTRFQLLLTIVYLICNFSDLAVSQDDEDEDERHVDAKPERTGDGEKITVIAGSAFRLMCPITNIGELPLIWKQKEDVIAMGNTVKVKFANKMNLTHGTLQVFDASPADTGIYTCLVTSEPPIQVDHYVTVVSENQIFFDPPSPVTVEEGKSLRLKCNLVIDSIKSTTKWDSSDKTMFDVVDNILMIKKVMESDDGSKFTCTKRTTEKTYKGTAVLNVLYPPSFVSGKEDIVNTDGEGTLRLNCDHKGNPKAVVSWFLDGELLPQYAGKTEVIVTNAKDVIGKTYECKLNDNLVRTIQIRETIIPIDVTVKKHWMHTGEGRTIKLECMVRSDPLATVFWLHNGSLVVAGENKRFTQDGEKFSLQVRNFRHDDFGNYTCWANNTFDVDFRTIVASGLATPVQLDVTKTNAEEARISYSSNSYSKIIAFDLQYRSVPNDKTKPWSAIILPAESSSYVYQSVYIFKNLEPLTTYEIIMRAKNIYGWNNFSDSLQFSLLTLNDSPDIQKSTSELQKSSHSDEKDESSSVSSTHLYLAEKNKGPSVEGRNSANIRYLVKYSAFFILICLLLS